MSKLFWQKY